MANRISSLEDAISLLIRLRDRSIPIWVAVSFPGGGIGFSGTLSFVDPSSFSISARSENGGSLRLSPLSNWGFFGEFEEFDADIYFFLSLVKRDEPENIALARIHLESRTTPFSKSNPLIN
jgi:hypothetical protein